MMKMDWSSELNNSICTVSQLRKYTDLSHDVEMKLNEIIKRHPMCVTPYYMSLIDWDNPSDPIKKIAIPSLTEFNLEGSYDTSGELENTKLSGLQHKYEQTALVLSTNKCATYCRYCFRKRLVGRPSNEVIKRFDEAAEYIKQHDEIDNVLISGGDPLVLSNEIIESFLAVLSDISHLKFIRFGSRTPVMLPSRFEDDELLDILRRYSQSDRRIYVVTQFNYPREISREAVKAINNLISAV
ncbi:lysine 2,3-aminomutase [Thermoplasmatales archaeon SCGC AB-539-C06]|nr:lysine 2,3-aminomutase [Thermoplasmatales archaeon SCGC AB-539-C06]